MEPQVLNDVPNDLKSLITNIVHSYAAWDILTYFYDTHSTIRADADEVASSIGREKKEVQVILDDLNKEEILKTSQEHDIKIYSSDLQGKLFQVISKFFQFTATREGRLKAIYIITAERCKRNL